MMIQVWGDSDGTAAYAAADMHPGPFYQGGWQGNGWAVIYSALFQAMTAWGTNRILHQMSRRNKIGKQDGREGEGDKSRKGSDLGWMEDQKAKLVAQCVSMTILYPLTKVITIVTTSASTTATPEALTILMETVSSDGFLLGLYGGLGSMVASHVLYQFAYNGILVWSNNARRQQRTNQKAESDESPKTLTTTGWARLARWSYSHLHWAVILTTATCFSYPLETSSRRQQLSTKRIPELHDDVNLWAGVGYAILSAVTHQVLLGVVTSDTLTIFFRRVVMKLLH
jgi:hypothetical protein